MNSDKKELVSQLVVPVIISNGSSAHRLALKLCTKYGVSPVLCGSHRGLWDIFDPFTDFLRVPNESEDLFVRGLKDYSEKMNGYVLILLPADEKDRLFFEKHTRGLESFYILASSYEEFKNLPLIKFA